MTKIYESYSECPIVEQLIWDQLAFYGDEFAGVKQLTKRDLLTLQSAVNGALFNMGRDDEQERDND